MLRILETTFDVHPVTNSLNGEFLPTYGACAEAAVEKAAVGIGARWDR